MVCLQYSWLWYQLIFNFDVGKYYVKEHGISDFNISEQWGSWWFLILVFRFLILILVNIEGISNSDINEY